MAADSATPKRHHLSRLQAQANVYRSWQFTRDRSARTKAARDAFLEQLADEADPEHKWSEAERQAAIEAGQRAHMRKMSDAAKKARDRKRQAKQNGNGNGAEP
jgi:hypothetical protein